MKIDAGAAYRYGDEDTGATFPMRASFQVLQLFESRHVRPFEAGPGWGVYPTTVGSLVHGPYFEAGLLWPMDPNPEGWSWRWGANAKAHYLLADELDAGFGLTLQGTVEWTGFVTGPFAECHFEASSDPYEDDADAGCAIGVAEGETSIGFFVETSYASLGSVDLGWTGGGLIFRLPASLGIALVPIWD
jgi:hypothetical protein